MELHPVDVGIILGYIVLILVVVYLLSDRLTGQGIEELDLVGGHRPPG